MSHTKQARRQHADAAAARSEKRAMDNISDQLNRTHPMIWKPHATVAAVIHRDDQYLMVEELIDGERVFNQPAGHLEDRESLQEAIIREVREETAWLFEPQYLLGIYRWRHPVKGNTHLRTTFVGTVSDHRSDQPLDEGITGAHWCTREQLLHSHTRLRSNLVLRCIDDYLAGQRAPLEILHDVD